MSAGNFAEFYLNGTRLSLATKRGMNVLVLRQDGRVASSITFDTHTSGSDGFASFVALLPQGTPVLLAAQDDAGQNLTTAARSAIRSLGGSLADRISYRSSYALAGIKGGSALAEQVRAETDGVSDISAVYRMGDTALSVTGVDAAGKTNFTVRSAAWSDGNTSIFTINGTRLDVAPGRGLNVVVLQDDGSFQGFYVFDTCASGSDAFVSLVSSLPYGTPVLVAVMDEASTNLTSAARAALRSLGSSLVGGLAFRSSYALVGIKGAAALSESLFPEHGGAAVAVGEYWQGAPHLPPTVPIRVRSAGFSDGNFAEFYVGGAILPVLTARGLNVVRLAVDGSFAASQTFDTHAAGSEALVSFITGLPLGTPVLVAARDEAMGNLSDAGKQALRRLGAVQMGRLTYRGSYALVGIAGGSALAELALPEKSGVAEVTTQYILSSISSTSSSSSTSTSMTLSTTTRQLWDCATYVCPGGSMLKADIWNVSGYDAGTCCGPVVDGVVPVAVKSAGFTDGNLASFYINGNTISATTGRGLNFVVLRAEGSYKASQVFDTMATGSDKLVSFVGSLAAGTVVLVAAADEAATNLTSGAKDAMKTLGATLIGNLRWRGSYALIGIKNGSAIAERVLPPGSGIAYVSGYIQVEAPPQTQKPVCNARSPRPPVAGWLSNGQLNLEDGCRYQLWESQNAANCLQGAWTVIVGGSNTILMAINLANLLSLNALLPVRNNASMGSATLVDVIIDRDNGGVVYSHSKLIAECNDPTKAIPQACRDLLAQEVAAAPAYNARGTRVTLFLVQYWDQAETALDVAMQDVSWASAKVALLVQVGTWYIYCSVKQVSWCTRPALKDKAESEGIEAALRVFTDDMAGTMERMQAICQPNGRAGYYGCIIGANSYQNPALSERAWYDRYNLAMEEVVVPISTDVLRYVDFWTLGEAMAEEEFGGHSSPTMMIWNWQVMLGGMCPADLASKGTRAVFDGQLCSTRGLSRDLCPDYYRECPHTFRCELWECMNSVPCLLRTSSGSDVPEEDTNGTCGQPVALSFPLAKQAAGRLCRRIWCDDGLEWVLPVAMWSAVIMLFLAGRYGIRLLPERLRAKLAPAPAPSKATRPPAAPEKSAQAAQVDDAPAGPVPGTAPSQGPAEPPAEPPAGPPPALPIAVAAEPHGAGEKPAAGQDVVHPASDAWRCRGCGTTNQMSENNCSMCGLHHWADPFASEDDAAGDDDDDDASDTGSSEPVSPRTPLRQAGALASIHPNETEADATAAAPALPQKQSAHTVKSKTSKNSRKKAPPAVRPAAGDKFPLGLARFLASTHIVLGHLFALGATPGHYFFGWGFTWVPWFFMLSGFVLMSAHLRRPKDETVLDYVMRRSVTIYPLYAVSLIPAFAIAKAANQTPRADVLAGQSLLMQAWVPIWTEQALQSHCWFLSAMVVYWACFKPLARFIRWLGLYTLLATMTVIFVMPWLVIWIPAATHNGVYWYEDHNWGATKTALDIGVVMLKFHPVCYFHVFIVGALLARLRLLLDSRATSARSQKLYSRALELVAPLGYLGVALVFSLRSLRPAGFKLSARLSVLLPFQAMILFGLAGLPSLPSPRLAWLAQKLDWLENYSFAVYVFQFLAYDFWPKQGVINLPLFFIYLWGLVALIVPLVQRPVQKWWGAHPRGRLAVPLVLGGLLVGLSFIPKTTSNPHVADLPSVLFLEPGMVDMRLPLTDPEDGSAAIINPSLLVANGKVYIAARRHRQEFTRSLGDYITPLGADVPATIIDQVWHSKILLGSADLDEDAWSRWPSTGVAPFSAPLSAWDGLRTAAAGEWADLCAEENWVAENSTLFRKIVTGPEDPKLIANNGSISLVFDSKPPESLHGCQNNTAHTQMYMASRAIPDDPKLAITGLELECGDAQVDEKNWIPFVYQGTLKFVYSPLPHTIVAAGEDASCQKVYETTFKPLMQLQKEHKSYDIRGSAQAVLVDDPDATPNLPKAHYLGLLHIFDRRTRGYAHVAYRFSASPPFNILQVSSQLPLLAAQAEVHQTPFAFANGLVIHNRTVVISYGAGDRDARAFVTTLQRLDQMFTCSGEDTLITITTSAAASP